MKKFAVPALVAALALAACDQSETTVEGDEVAAPAPTATETAVVTDTVAVPVEGDADKGSSLTIDGGDVDATISEDGVKADIKID
ncbi:hypothetical protein P7228_08875 [Altererythrobacter arenosus]|uniref:Uncharacterized protein n=1 Tax=Altererythrobacter arenosus TaxID=3032592 RepID=A0ABY8FM88_9SPHN|nr:hypothetical protein [Altererythrobacter sp. CAU 1644]WFL76118.1 hypothetical protein P7228_08875 [Altererythrobacter sp. CAU 1644]